MPRLFLTACFAALSFFFVPVIPPAQACSSCWASGCTACCNSCRGQIEPGHVRGRPPVLNHITTEVSNYRSWLTDTLWRQQVLPALQRMTEQLTAVGMEQVFIFGTFLDAKHQLETQRLFQELQFQAHRDYQPSDDFCWFGTNVRSLGSSEQLGKLNVASLASIQLKRHLGNAGTAGALSRDLEKAYRWQQFREDYCDTDDNNRMASVSNTGLELVCTTTGTKRVNNDIDFTRVIDEVRTLDVAFDDASLTSDEEDVIAMGNNLYGHDVLTRLADNEYLKNREYQHLYLALRSVAAKRTVAQNSYNAIIGLKAAGTDGTEGPPSASQPGTHDFLAAIIRELGVTNAAEIDAMLGAQPSYYAQLEILAKKIYQNPDFFAGLYDSPANVERKSVALKAIELMLDRAIYESQIRQEMATSVLLSTRLQPLHDKVNQDLTSSGGE